jgi:hypothetical protein
MYKWILAIVFCGAVAGEGYAQEAYPQLPPQKVDSLFLPVDQLFSLGVENSLKLRADAIKEKLSAEQKQTARTSRLPDLQIGLKGGCAGTAGGLSAGTFRSYLSRYSGLVAELCG